MDFSSLILSKIDSLNKVAVLWTRDFKLSLTSGTNRSNQDIFCGVEYYEVENRARPTGIQA